MKKICTHLLRIALISCAFVSTFSHAETNPRFYAVELSASVEPAPARITLNWVVDENATSYTISRKALTGTSWSPIATLAGAAVSWSDLNVANGNAYEYQVIKTTSLGYKGTGYILAGINSPMTENRGKVVLIVDNTYASQLTEELSRLQMDLVGDGWTVLRHDVSRTDSVLAVKNLIRTDYNADKPNVKSVFLFGHVPVPYSGDFNPDGHPDHKGAWAADVFYADMDGSWTDSSVNDSGANKPWNWNVPGDGKFDQSELPSDAELQVGRVDLYNLTCYANKTPSRTELDLLRAYLEKDHNFRTGQLAVQRRGLICDNFGETSGEAFASTGWRSFAPFFGADNDTQVGYGAYFSTLKDNPYLCSYGTGGGSWYTCNGIGGSDDFAITKIKSVFTVLLGSYFGDWDNESAFLRAPLGSGYCLASAWGGRPHWFLHPMGLGETIGFTARLSQNNRPGGMYAPQNYGSRGVHVALQGDPTLRLHPVIPPANVTAGAASGSVTLNWSASPDSNIEGYVVYRASSVNGPFTRISGTGLLSTLGMTDATGVAGSVYMVRAVKLENSGSGTYYNPSQGVIVTAGGTAVVPAPAPTPTPTPVPAPSATNAPFNNGTNGTSAAFVADDSATQGDWKIAYGADGHIVVRDSTALPSYAAFTLAPGYSSWTWADPAKDSGSLQRALASTSIASCWYSAGEFSINFRFNDGQAHRVSFYFLDWDKAGRKQTLELYDGDSGALLATRTIANFGGGLYSTWDLKGNVRARLVKVSGPNCVVSGVFFAASGSNEITDTAAATSEATGTTSPATNAPSVSVNMVRALARNSTTLGSWKGSYGLQGYQIIGNETKLPAYADVALSGKSDWIWNWSTTDLAALQRGTAADRLAACSYAPTTFDIAVKITDGQTHKVSIHCLDWDAQNRTEKIEVLDGSSGALLNTVNVSSFEKGTYLSWDIKGSVRFRVTRTGPLNAVVSGLFFDAPTATL